MKQIKISKLSIITIIIATIFMACDKDTTELNIEPGGGSDNDIVEHYVSESQQLYLTAGTYYDGQTTHYLVSSDLSEYAIIIEKDHVRIDDIDIQGEDNITIIEGENQNLTVTLNTQSASFFEPTHGTVTYIHLPTVTYVPLFDGNSICGFNIIIEANYEYAGENMDVSTSYTGELKETIGDGEHMSYPLDEGVWKAYKVVKHTEYNENTTSLSSNDTDYYLNHENISQKLDGANNIFALNNDYFNFPLLVRNEISNEATITNIDINGSDPEYISYGFQGPSWIDNYYNIPSFTGYHYQCSAGFYCFFVGEDGEEPFGSEACYGIIPSVDMNTHQVIDQPVHIIYLSGSLPHTLYEIYVNRTGIEK
ncbi:MAG: hypothetical protein GQ564_02300 [Bacteroidales bacterium]|nr:hypothetical protein [Bacteroidales bacterium]